MCMVLPWLKTSATHYHAKLGLPDKDSAIKGLGLLGSRSFQPAIRSGPRLLSTGRNKKIFLGFQ